MAKELEVKKGCRLTYLCLISLFLAQSAGVSCFLSKTFVNT